MFGIVTLRMIRKILIACRGDVARRLIGEYAEADVQTVAVYTMEDYNSEHARLADEAICIGKTSKSYHIDWPRIISAAEISDVDAIHTGDGPLSTHERFAEVCDECDIHLINGNAEPFT
jgi:acetyl-CoA carboxylase biotin carboxylase subunit